MSGAVTFRQPRAVWAVAFAATVAFMGIGLVDPILPAIADDLGASETEAELLFTSYLLVTGLAMLATGWVASRIGAKRALLVGLALVVVFAALAGTAGGIDAVIGFRAGWGLGNALFIATALATIIGAASGGSAGAIVLYEAALGVGIALGPLLGGLLGGVSWRAPFFGTAALMAIGFAAIAVLLPRDAGPRPRIAPLASVRALRVPPIAVLAAAAACYNIAFFTLLAYTPFALAPFELGELGLGLVFFGWGVALAVTSVLVAGRLTARLRRSSVLLLAFALLAADLVAVGGGAAIGSLALLVSGVVAGGAILGVVNTVLTETVLEATDLPRAVASGAYSSVRFLGGAAAPPLAALLAALGGQVLPYLVAAGFAIAAGCVVLAWRPLLRRADDAGRESAPGEAQAIATGDA